LGRMLVELFHSTVNSVNVPLSSLYVAVTSSPGRLRPRCCAPGTIQSIFCCFRHCHRRWQDRIHRIHLWPVVFSHTVHLRFLMRDCNFDYKINTGEKMSALT
jgi:hypothetical protein